MAGEKIFIVEDEKIVAEDLKRMLERMGYQIVGSVANGDLALKEIEKARPNLVLMDIRIQGSLDGIDVAESVFTNLDIPVVYLTAYADDPTVDRAKGTLPAGYILKPFEERGLKTTIEMALYRHNMEKMIKSVEEWHEEILGSLGVAILAVDSNGIINYMNKSAEKLTGQLLDHVLGKPLNVVLTADNGDVDAHSSKFFITDKGKKFPIECKESVTRDREGNATGKAFLLKESSPSASSAPPR